MAIELADLVMRINADSRQLKRELRAVESRNRRATSAVRKQWASASGGIAGAVKQLSRFTGIGAAIGAGFSLFALKGQIDQALEFSDSIDKTSQRLGIGTGALQEWRFAADQSGVAARTLDLAVQRFTRRSAEAANGTGEAKDALKELRIELRGADGQIRTTEALFEDAVEALAGIENPAERLRLAFKLFDSEGVSVLQMVDRFQELRAEARELGVVLDESTIKRAVEAKDKLAALGLATRAQLVPALVDLAPILVSIAEKFASAARFAGDLFARSRDIKDLGQDALSGRASQLRAELEEATTALDELRSRRIDADEIIDVRTFGDALRRSGQAIRNLLEGETTAGIAEQALSIDVEQITQELDRVEQEIKARLEAPQEIPVATPDAQAFGAARNAIEAIEAQISGFERLRAASEEVYSGRIADIIEIENKARTANVDLTTEQGQRYLELSLALAGLEDDAESYSKAQQNVNQIMLAGRTPAQVLSEDIERLQEDFNAGRISADQLEASIESLNTQFEENRKKSEKSARTYFDELEGLGEAFVGNFSRSMADMLLTGELTFQSLAQSFARDFVAASIQSLTLSALTSVFGSTTGGGEGGGGGILAGLFGKRAAGGPIRAGMPYLVGERGPELIIPKASGFVVPNEGLRAASAERLVQATQAAPPPASVYVSVINETDGQATVSERTGPSGTREVEVLISRAVAGEISQGGPIARAIDTRFGSKPRGV